MTYYNVLKSKHRIFYRPLVIRKKIGSRPYSSSGTTSKNFYKKNSISDSFDKMTGYINAIWKYMPSGQKLNSYITSIPSLLPKISRNTEVIAQPPKPKPRPLPQVTQPPTEPVDMAKALAEMLVSDKDIIEEMQQPVNNKPAEAAKKSSSNASSSSSLFEWMYWSKSNKDHPSKLASKKNILGPHLKLQGSIEGRTIFLLKSLTTASSSPSRLQRLEELCRHLLVYPEEKNLLIKKGALSLMLRLQHSSTSEEELYSATKQALSLLGYTSPPGGRGLRILSIDGGGTRGIMAIEILRQLEKRTKRPVYELFDYACGVSTGAIIVMVLFGARRSVDECEQVYLTLSKDIFSRNALVGTGNLLWNQAYYDTAYYVTKLRDYFGDLQLIDTSKYSPSPKISAVSTIMNQPLLKLFVFRNYVLPFRANSVYPGSCQHKVWEAVRASGAAPGYFESFNLDDYVHQDGGLVMNNPTALAIHEAKVLWPHEKIQCVVSLGSGRFKFLNDRVVAPGLKTTLYKVLDSATDTEALHTVLRDHLPSHTYFRFNPYMSEQIYLDEYKQEKLEGLKMDAYKYLQWNEHKLDCAVQALTRGRSPLQSLMDALTYRSLLWKK